MKRSINMDRDDRFSAHPSTPITPQYFSSFHLYYPTDRYLNRLHPAHAPSHPFSILQRPVIVGIAKFAFPSQNDNNSNRQLKRNRDATAFPKTGVHRNWAIELSPSKSNFLHAKFNSLLHKREPVYKRIQQQRTHQRERERERPS